jgi:sugar phosphate isomerase/epimerase
MLTFNTTATKHLPLVMELDVARAAGFQSVEILGSKVQACLDSGFSETEVEDLTKGLAIKGIGALVDVERQGADLPNLLREADDLFGLANLLGAEGVQIVTGPLDYRAALEFADVGSTARYAGLLGHSDRDKVKLTAANLRRLCDMAQARGLILYIEALAWASLNTIEQQLELLDATGRDNLKLVVDYWHCYVSGAMPATVAKIDKDLIYGVHVCDSLTYVGGVPNETLLRDIPTGEGVLDLFEWTQAVKSTGYDGWWSSETFCRKQQQQDGYAVAKRLKAQLERLVG